METQTAQIIATQVDKVMAQLDKLAIKLGLTVEQIWPWMVKQQYVGAISSLVSFLMFSIAGYLIYRHLKEVIVEQEIDEMTFGQMAWIAMSIAIGIGLFISSIYFCCTFSIIFNAEYWALKDLMKMIR